MRLPLWHILVVIVYGALIYGLGWASYITRSLPEPLEIVFRVPEGAEVLPSNTVHPGTFKIDVSVETILAAATSGRHLLVTHGAYEFNSATYQVEYWLPREDGNVFYHAEQFFRLPDVHFLRIDRVGGIATTGHLRLIPSTDLVVVLLLSELVCILSLIAIGLLYRGGLPTVRVPWPRRATS